MKELEGLRLPEEAFDWIRSWLESCEGSNHSPDLNQVDMCEDLSKRQMAQVKEKLKVFFRTDDNLNDAPEKLLDPGEIFLKRVLEVLDSRPDIQEQDRSWVLNNIGAFESLAELDENEDMSRKQINFLKTAFAEDFEIYLQSKNYAAKALSQSNFSGVENFGDNENKNIGMTFKDSIDEFGPGDKNDGNMSCSVVPLIIFGSEVQEGFAVEKFSLSGTGVKHLCDLVPNEMLGDTPVLYQSVSNGYVIDFETMDKLSMECIGFFGPFDAVLENLEKIVPLRSLEDLRGSLMSQKTGLYLISSSAMKTDIILFLSENDSDFASVKKDSRAVHFLRYMSQLTNNFVMCMNEKYQDRLALNEEEVRVKSDRRSIYNLKKHEVQQESIQLKSLGSIQDTNLKNAILHPSQVSLFAVSCHNTEASWLLHNEWETGSVRDLKPFMDKMVVSNLGQISSSFKKEYLEAFSSEDFGKILIEIEQECQETLYKLEQETQKLVVTSVALYFVESELYHIFQIIKKYLIHNLEKTEKIWEKRMIFDLLTIDKVIATRHHCDIREELRKNTEARRVIDKYLLWDALANTKKKLPLSVFDKGFDQVTWKELLSLAEK